MSRITTFTIIKGQNLEFKIIVKENGTTLPLELGANDLFTYTLSDKKTGEVFIPATTMVVSNGMNGEVTGTILGSVTANLPRKVSAPEDFFMPRPNLRLVVNGYSTVQGVMTAFIEHVYVVGAV